MKTAKFTTEKITHNKNTREATYYFSFEVETEATYICKSFRVNFCPVFQAYEFRNGKSFQSLKDVKSYIAEVMLEEGFKATFSRAIEA